MTTITSTPPVDAAADRVARPGRRRARRLLAASIVAAVGVTGVLAWRAPTGTNAQEPGPILDLASRVHIDSVPTTPISGAYLGLTVRHRPLSLGDRFLHAVTGDPSPIVPDSRVHPPGVPLDTYHAQQKAAYVDGGQVAAAVAERALGHVVTITTDSLSVQAVVADSPAAASLRVGDQITAVDGKVPTSSEDLANAVQASGGQPLTLTIEDPAQPGTSRTTAIVPKPTGADQRLVLGVVVEPANMEIQLPIPVTIDDGGVEGPSAGLMTALTVYDELSLTDLAAGRHIAGTGTLAADGNVGEIGGIQAKARAAAAAGADLFLAPADQADDARAVLSTRVPVIGVTTFQQALDALATSPTPASP